MGEEVRAPSDFFCRRIIMVYAQLQKYVKVGGKL